MYRLFTMAMLIAASVSLTPTPAAAQDDATCGLPYWPSDANGDGKVTLSEMQASSRTAFLMADTDNDGRLSVAEWVAGAKKLRQRLSLLGLSITPRPMEERFLRIDTDRDRYVTPDELDAATLRRFDRRDLNRNGFITFDEASRVDVVAIQP